jgi:hypothetical protein
MEYICARCGYKASQKIVLQKHLRTITPCECKISDESRESLLQKLEKKYNEDAKACEGCAKKFNSRCNYYSHRKKCDKYIVLQSPSTPNTSTQSSEQGNDKLIALLEKQQEQIKSQQEQYEKMMAMIEKLVDKPIASTSNNITNNIQINQQNNLNLNSFGKESHAHLTDEQMTSFIQNREIIDLIKTISFNPDYPENHNVKRITSSKDWYKNQFLSVYNENGEWTNSVKEKVLETVVSNGFKVMYNHFFNTIDSNPMNITDESVDFTRWFNENFTNPKSFIKDVFALTLDEKFLAKH